VYYVEICSIRIVGKMKSQTFKSLKALLVGLLVVSFAMPTQIAQASPPDPQSQASEQAQQASEKYARAQGEEPVWDGSTNCEVGQTPFLSGVVRDAVGEPLGGAKVVAKIFSQVSFNMTGQFSVYQTKTDGSYSICAQGTWSETFGELQTQAATMIMTVQPPESLVTRTAATTLFALSTQLPASVTSNRDNRCLKPASVTTPCVMNVTLLPPVIGATVKKQDGTLLPYSRVSLEYKLGTTFFKWTTIADIRTNEEGWFGFAGFVQSNSFRVRVTPDGYDCIETECVANNLGSASDNFAVAVTTQGDPTTASAVWESSASNSTVFTVLPANFIGTLKDVDSQTVKGYVQVLATQSSTQKTQELWTSDGKFLLTLDDGDWVVDVKNQGDALIKNTSFNVTATGGVVTSVTKVGGGAVCSIGTTACAVPLNLPIDEPNFMAIVKDDLGGIVKRAWLSGSSYDCTETVCVANKSDFLQAESGDPADEWNPRPAGVLGLDLAANKIYRLQLSPPYEGDTEVTAMLYYVKTFAVGSGIKVQKCAIWDNNPQTKPCTSGFFEADLENASNTMQRTDGKFTLEMPTANFKGVLCSPDAGCSVVGDTYVQVYRQQASQCQNCSPNYSWLPGSSVRSDGTFSISLTQVGKYRLEVDPPDAKQESASAVLYAKSRLEFEAVSDGLGGYNFFTLDSSGNRTSTPLATTPVVNKGNRVVVRFLAPSVVGLVRAPDATVAENTWVEIQKEVPTLNNPNNREYSNARVNQFGVFALSLSVGRYILNANPSWNLESQNLTKTEVRISALDCNSDGSIEVYTYESTQCLNAVLYSLTDGKLIITLIGANFLGTLRRPDNDSVVPNASLNVEKWTTSQTHQDGGYWQWANKWANTKSNGVFGLNFDTAGLYRVTFNVQGDLTALFSASRMIVQVAGSETLTVTPEPDATTWASDGNGGYSVKLRLPNVSGTLTLPNGAALPSGASAYVQVEKWNTTVCMDGCYQWTSEVNGTSTNALGDYAMSIPVGRWKLTYSPPYGSTGYAKTVREIIVTNTDVCLLANAVNNACLGAKILPGVFDVALATPNYSGTVKNPNGTLSTFTSAQFQKYNSVTGYWDWTNNWINTDSLGRFGVNLTENQTYKVIFDAAYTSTGVAPVTKYIRVCNGGDTVSSLANEAEAITGATCPTMGVLSGIEIYLLGSNVRGIVKDSTGTALTNVWISVQNCGTGISADGCRWDRGVNSKSDSNNLGKFDIRLENSAPRLVTKFNIEVNPPYNSATGLVRVVKSIWVKDFDNVTGDDWCLDSNYTPGVGGGSCSTIPNSDFNWEITMTAGNLAGKVMAPTGSTAIPQAQIQVEKWARPEWDLTNGSFGWQWQNTWANANQSGVFGLDIATAGLYRVSVSPGWENTSSYARRRYVVRVDGAGDWCVKTGLTALSAIYPTDNAAPDNDACSFERDNDPTDGVDGFGLRVSNSNLRGVLYTSSTDLTSTTALADASKKIRDGWIGIQKKRAEGWWEWQGGVNSSGATASKGTFATNIESDGEYRFEFNTPWTSAGEDAGFKIEFTASNCSTLCVFTGFDGPNVNKISDVYNVKYLAPNFSGIVFDKTSSTKIAGSWLSVMNSTTGQWIGGVSTGWNGSNLGRFALRLEDGLYRVEVNPRWDDANNGIRRILQVKVESGVVTSCGASGCVLEDTSWDVSLLGETVSGKVYYPGLADTTSDEYAAATDGIQTVMPWAWAEVRSCDDELGTSCNTYVEWQNSNQSGIIKFGLADSSTPYLVRLYPNWSMYAGSPLEILVKVVGGASTWKYKADNTSYSSDAFTPDFGHIPPNVAVTITGISSSRYVDLYRCDGIENSGDCDTGWEKIVTVLASIDGSDWKANFLVSEVASYKVVVIRQTGDNPANRCIFSYNGAGSISCSIALAIPA
jgi:hypothetical protein